MYKPELLGIGILVMLCWVLLSVVITIPFPNTINGNVSGIVKQYNGDNAPYSILNVTADGKTYQVTVSCDYYSKGSQIQIITGGSGFVIWPFATFTRQTVVGNTQAGCNHS